MSPELQKAVTDALVVIIPAFATAVAVSMSAFAAWVVRRIGKNKRDMNAAFEKLRVHEKHMGIETCVKGGKTSVTGNGYGNGGASAPVASQSSDSEAGGGSSKAG